MVEFYIDGKEWYKTLLKMECDSVSHDEPNYGVPFDDALIVLKGHDGTELHRSWMVNLLSQVADRDKNNCVLYIVAYCTIKGKTVSFLINAYQHEDSVEVFFDPLEKEYISNQLLFNIDNVENYEKRKHENIAIGIFNELWLVMETCQQRQNHYKYTKEYEKHQLMKIPQNVKYTSVNLRNIECRFTKEVDNRLEETRQYVRHIDAWYCRGHVRHYKSGKVVWVKPHIKGSGKVKGTAYTIEG